MINYILELVIIHTVLVLAYWFFLRKESQYGKMRYFLLGATLLSLVIPFLRLPQLFSIQGQPIQVLRQEVVISQATVINPTIESGTFNYNWMIWFSLVVSCIFLLKLMARIAVLVNMNYRSVDETYNGINIKRLSDVQGSFTFFSWIFLGEEIDESQDDYNVILKHELAHARLGHSYDLIFIEIYKAIFWWLPSSWYVNMEIRKLHEYEADSYALKTIHVDLYSSILINSTLQSHGLSLASSFHDGLIFKRLKAMKQQAKKVSNWKVGLLTTLCAFLFVLFACSEEKSNLVVDKATTDKSQLQREVFTKVEEQPTYEGGMSALYQYITNEIRYPKAARSAGVEGTVDVQLVIERDGSVSNVKALNSIGAGCDEEAVRVIKGASEFKAGSQRGRTVRVAMVIPITFKLNPDKRNPDNSVQGMIITGEANIDNGELDIDASYKKGAWSGTISSPEGDKLPGVNIVVAGTNYGTVSDLDGTFRVEATEEQELHISFVGYKSAVLKK